MGFKQQLVWVFHYWTQFQYINYKKKRIRYYGLSLSLRGGGLAVWQPRAGISRRPDPDPNGGPQSLFKNHSQTIKIVNAGSIAGAWASMGIARKLTDIMSIAQYKNKFKFVVAAVFLAIFAVAVVVVVVLTFFFIE